MAKKSTAAGLLGMLGSDPSQQASTLLRLGTMGVVREMTMAADRRVAQRGGAPWTPSINRAKRQAAAAVRRQAPLGSVTRSAARAVAVSSRPSAVQRRSMRRESYRQQGEKLTPEQLIAIPASELPPELAERRREAMANRPRDEKGRFLPKGASTPASDRQAAVERRQELEQKLRLVVGDFDKLPPQVRHNLQGQINRQVAEEFAPAAEPHSKQEGVQAVLGQQPGGAPSTEREKEPWETFTGRVDRSKQERPAAGAATAGIDPGAPPPEPSPQPTPAQRKQENVQAVIASQLEDAPQPKRETTEKSGGWLDKVQMGLDAAGVADPTPIADGTNAVISLGRAVADPERRGEHLQNAAISTVSAVVPYVGDAAKLLKVGRAAKKAHAVQGAGRVAAREGTAAAAVGAQPSTGGGIGGTIRRMAGGAIGSMFGGGGESKDAAGDRSARSHSGLMDKVQAGLDVVGIADPTPVTDWTNGAISLARAAIDPQRRGEHLENAGISVLAGAVPYAGDTAKLLKVGRAAERGDAVRGASRRAEESTERAAGRDSFSSSAPTGSGASPPSEPPRYGGPSPASDDDGGNSPRRQREEAEGIAAHDQWTEKLKDGALSMASFAGKVYLAVEGLKFLNQGVMNLNRGLAEYSGPLAGAYAKADNADIRRDMKRANALSGPLSRLQEETSELQDTMSEMVTPIQGILIEILAAITWGANKSTSVLEGFFPKITMALDLLGLLVDKDEDGAPGARQFLQDLSDGRFDGFGIDDVGKRFEILDKATRAQMGLTAQPKRPKKGKAPAPP